MKIPQFGEMNGTVKTCFLDGLDTTTTILKEIDH